ncbi:MULTISPECIES: hypothetical protein [Pontibacter]|uniref:Uncharacterized protein n=1 Tax=Pontibacter lucknowensis TaxID=1077936 RepID=A0A1N6YKI9_9BACT|nr:MULTISPECIES: hypothetical protein [Pontibacter]EJF09137.1 hypothetical protein O71_16741 [Pontibacter sp. BAB1700]SIR15092.1 hypothetical protein SAMN05421545_2553 [Pontibacter lucknowensis]
MTASPLANGRHLLLTCLRWSLALSLILLVAAGCTRREAFPEESEEEPLDEEAGPKYDGQLLAQVVFDEIDFVVPQQELIQPFIKEFGNGTVVNKVTIHKVQDNKKLPATYYLVGLGIHNGSFRSMALELDVSSDNSLYLSSKSMKHICEATAGCDFCYFTFEDNRITGCQCSIRAAGYDCRHKVQEGNNLLQGVRLKNSGQN